MRRYVVIAIVASLSVWSNYCSEFLELTLARAVLRTLCNTHDCADYPLKLKPYYDLVARGEPDIQDKRTVLEARLKMWVPRREGDIFFEFNRNLALCSVMAVMNRELESLSQDQRSIFWHFVREKVTTFEKSQIIPLINKIIPPPLSEAQKLSPPPSCKWLG